MSSLFASLQTLLVDQARLYDMRNRCNQLIVVASSLLIAWNSVGTERLASAADKRKGIKDRLLVITDDIQREWALFFSHSPHFPCPLALAVVL